MTPGERLVEALNDALPQTQCTRCGYPDCRSYARAIAFDGIPINQCPPGGIGGIARLALISGRPAAPLNPLNGVEAPRLLAVIDEAWCIGCTLCLKACPVDSIVGASKLMHTVVAAQCTGCELCIPACPVDCISLVPDSGTRTGWDAWSTPQADEARDRYAFHVAREARSGQEHQAQFEQSNIAESPDDSADPVFDSPSAAPRSAIIQAAIARARSARATD